MKKSTAESKVRELQTYGLKVIALYGNKKKQVGTGDKEQVTSEVFTRIQKAASNEVNLAIYPTGDLLVIDVDVKDGAQGMESYAALCEQFATLHPTRTPQVRTPSGGFHRFFKVPAGFRLHGRTLDEYPGIDFLHNNNYAVCPPSNIWSKAYKWETGLNECPIADLPADMVAFLQTTKNSTSPKVDLRTTSLLSPKHGEGFESFRREAGSLLSHYSAQKTYELLLPHVQAVGGTDSWLKALVDGLARREEAKAEEFERHRFDSFEETECHFEPLDVPFIVRECETEVEGCPAEERNLPEPSKSLSQGFLPQSKMGENLEEHPSLIPFSDLLTSTPPVIDWRVQGLFPTVGVNFIAGQGGLGKSWLGMDLGLAVATSRSWLGHYATTPTPVLYLDLENSKQTLSRRFNKLLVSLGMTPPEVTNFNFYRPESLMLDEISGFTAVGKALQVTGAKLLVVDSFTRIHAGDENSVKDMAKISKSLLCLANTFEVCIVVIDHLGKTAGNGLRGSSEKRALPETILEVERGGSLTQMKVSVTKLRPTGDVPEPFFVELVDPTPTSTRVSRIADCCDVDIAQDSEVEWMAEYLRSHGGMEAKTVIHRDAFAGKGWGVKKVNNILRRGVGQGLWDELTSRSVETNRPHTIIQLTSAGPEPSLF